MTLLKDSKRLLSFLYEYFTNRGKLPTYDRLLELTKWDKKSLNIVTGYLVDRGYLEAIRMADGHFIIKKITAFGIEFIENPKKFEHYSEHKVNLGVYQFTYGVKENK